MGIFSWLCKAFVAAGQTSHAEQSWDDDDEQSDFGVNPASGLPMLTSTIDVAGNVLGSCSSDDDD